MNSIEEIAQDAISKIASKDLKYVKESPITELHHTLGRWIRNSYNLWHDSPITENWRNNPDKRDMREGIDHSKDHPDAISTAIIKRMKELL